ncbi:MAG: DUF4956 domain-containing protein [Anaerolineales bacterium]|nr:MAG: DUF4956 domain-containing protein [Anaerolineales bacterium]
MKRTNLKKSLKNKLSLRLSFVLMLTTLLLLLPISVGAQDGGWEESFSGGELEGWELGPDVAVANGELIISPGNFAARLGEFADFHLTFKLRWDQEGAFRVVFYGRDESEYALVVFPGEVFIERRMSGPPIQIGQVQPHSLSSASWHNIDLTMIGTDLKLFIDEQQFFELQDENPLRSGALVFINIGSSEMALDDVRFEPQAVDARPGEPPGEGEPAVEGGPSVEKPQGEGPVAPPIPTPTATPTATGLTAFIQELSTNQSDPLQLTSIALNLALSALFAFILGQAYIYWGMSLSNRRSLAANFMLITVTTTFIILIVRSSVALSLGLVGALSIVRFRAAIKEPEELAYLFFAIGLGIGLGDNQRLLTLVALLVGLILIGLGRLFRRGGSDVNLHLTVSGGGESQLDLELLLEALKHHTRRLRLQRLDENGERMEASFLVEFDNLAALQNARASLRELAPQLEITFLDNRGVV